MARRGLLLQATRTYRRAKVASFLLISLRNFSEVTSPRLGVPGQKRVPVVATVAPE